MKRARTVPKVKVYSRHRTGCKWEGKSERLSCDCPKQLIWHRDGKLNRVSAETCDGEVAEGKARDIENDFERAASGKEVEPEPERGKLLEDAINLFIASKRQTGITEKHIKKLVCELAAFSQFALTRGLVTLRSIRTEDILEYRNSLEGMQNTRAKKVFRLIGFFEFAVEMGWIARNVARADAVILKYDDTQKPRALTDSQFETLLASVPRINGRSTDELRRKLRGLMLLMRWTGMAIRDAVTIERNRFQKNGAPGFTKLFLYRAKTGKPVYATLRDELVAEVFSLANPEGRYLFIDAVPTGEAAMNSLVQAWGFRMRKLSALAELRDENGAPYHFTSHALRHSFVLWALNAGLPTEDVAALIGDTVQVVSKHYSEWIHGRQERLNERMMAALK